jgi:hypothetical protein
MPVAALARPTDMIRVQVGEQHVVDIGRIGLRSGEIVWEITGVGSQRVSSAGVDQDPAPSRSTRKAMTAVRRSPSGGMNPSANNRLTSAGGSPWRSSARIGTNPS